MKNSFTLIELLFVIVVVGILTVVAIPKFKNLQTQAKVRSILKTAYDGAQVAYEAGMNLLYLENNNSFKLKDILSLTAKGWKYNAAYKEGAYYYPNEANNASYASIVLVKENGKYHLAFRILCDQFEDDKEKVICHEINDLYSRTYWNNNNEILEF